MITWILLRLFPVFANYQPTANIVNACAIGFGLVLVAVCIGMLAHLGNPDKGYIAEDAALTNKRWLKRIGWKLCAGFLLFGVAMLGILFFAYLPAFIREISEFFANIGRGLRKLRY